MADALRASAQDDDATLYALVDCARHDELLRWIAADGAEHASLYRGSPLERYHEAAPILAVCPEDSTLFHELTTTGWGQSLSVALTARAPLGAVAEHLRHLVLVRVDGPDEDDPPVLFRFYDPRVLRSYLPTCTERELARLFGPVTAFYAEAEGGTALLSFCFTARHERPRPASALGRARWLEAPGTDGAGGEPPQADAPLVVRPAQVEVLQRQVAREFENGVMRRLREAFPERSAALDEVALRSVVRFGIERAASYGIRREWDVYRWIDCQLRLGADFDSAPEHRWARDILDDPTASSSRKMDRIVERLQAMATAPPA